MLLVVRMVEEQSHRDDEGRPLREGRTPSEHLRPGDIEYTPCPYAGSRREPALPMNVSALRQMSAHWDDIIGSITLVRDAYRAHRGIAELDVMDAWRVSQLGSALPWWFILAKSEVAPAYAAALAKAMQGVGLWAQRDFVRMLAGTWRAPPLTAASILALTEANGTLIGETEVCSGPEKMLLRFFEAMVGDAPADHASPSPQLARSTAERDQVLAFGAYYLNFKIALWIHFLARRFVHADIVAALGPQVDERAAHAVIAQRHGDAVPLDPASSSGSSATKAERATRTAEIVAGFRELLDAPCEPPDFFTIGPNDLAATPPTSRAAWLRTLSTHIVPCAPDRSDFALQVCAIAISTVLEPPTGAGAVEQDDLAVEVDRVTGCGAAAASAVASAIETWAVLDGLFAQLVGTVEAGFQRAAAGVSLPRVAPAVIRNLDDPAIRAAVTAETLPPEIAAAVDAATRDRLTSPVARKLLAALAPRGFAARCIP
jgi:hypothetical protein